MSPDKSQTVEEAVRNGDVIMSVGNWWREEPGGITVMERGSGGAWIWTDSPMTNKR